MTDSAHPRYPKQHLTDIDIAKILALAKAELPQREIASIMSCSQHAVQHALAMYTFETFQGQHPRREYPRKTTQREDRYIKRTLKQNSFLPLRDITNIVGLPVSEITIRRRRSEMGLGSYIAAHKPGLSEEQMANRLQ